MSKLKFNKSRKEYLKQINEAIKHSPDFEEGMTAVLAGGVSIEIHKGGVRLDSIKAQKLLSYAHKIIFPETKKPKSSSL